MIKPDWLSMTVSSQSPLKTDNTSRKGVGLKSQKTERTNGPICVQVFSTYRHDVIKDTQSDRLLGKDLCKTWIKCFKRLWILLQLRPGLYRNQKVNPPIRPPPPTPRFTWKHPLTPTFSPTSQLCLSPAWPTTSLSHPTARWRRTPSTESAYPPQTWTWCTQPWAILVSLQHCYLSKNSLSPRTTF